MARKSSGTHSQLIRCTACGEDYSATYKRCPFCGDKPQASPAAEEDDEYVFEGGYVFDEPDTAEEDSAEPASRGGKRLASDSKGGSLSELFTRLNLSPVRVIGFVFTLLIIIGAVLILSKVLLPMIQRGSLDNGDTPSSPAVSESVSPSPSADADADSDPDSDSDLDADPAESDEPIDTIPDDQTATGLKLSYTEFSISDRYPDPVTITATLLPEGSTATITWTSSNPSVISVDQNGVVTALGKGSATITASIPSNVEVTCYVISTLSGSSSGTSNGSTNDSTNSAANGSDGASSSDSTTSSTPSGALTLNRSDFTLSDTYPTFTFTVTGATGTVSWSSSDSSVATVDASGKVTKVGSGRCTVTATDESGNTASCIVRCG